MTHHPMPSSISTHSSANHLTPLHPLISSLASFSPSIPQLISLSPSRPSMALSRMVSTLAVLVLAMALVQHVSAQCGNVNSLVGCLGAATKGDQPTAACCNAMTAFAQYGTPQGEACLCQAINNPTAKSAGAKPQFAIQIPQKCNLNYKAGYVCNGMVVPGGHA